MKANTPLFSDQFFAELAQLKAIQKHKSALGETGTLSSRKKGGQIDFHEHRLYQKGDEPRHIDWNVYHRLRQLTVKIFNRQETAEHFIILDASASMKFTQNSKAFKASQIAAAIAYLNLTTENTIQLYWLNQHQHKTVKMHGGKSIIPLLKTISEIQFDGTANISKAIQEIAQTNRQGNISILSDFYEAENILRTVSQLPPGRFSINLFQILSLQEINFPQAGLFTIQDIETDQQKKIHITQQVKKKYHEQMTHFIENIKKTALHLHCDFYQLNADTSFAETIQNLRAHHFFK